MTAPSRTTRVTLTEAVAVDDVPPVTLEAVAEDSYDVDPVYLARDTTLPVDRFLDRELSWLRCHQRALELAEDEDVPLLERARSAAILASNVDE